MDEKVKYQNLLSNLNTIASNLSSSINSLESAKSYSKEAINIDGTCYKKSEIDSLISDLKVQYNNLRNIYIPEVKKKIMEAQS